MLFYYLRCRGQYYGSSPLGAAKMSPRSFLAVCAASPCWGGCSFVVGEAVNSHPNLYDSSI